MSVSIPTMRGKWEMILIVAVLIVLLAVTLASLWQIWLIETGPVRTGRDTSP
jgi:hypothetical protein